MSEVYSRIWICCETHRDPIVFLTANQLYTLDEQDRVADINMHDLYTVLGDYKNRTGSGLYSTPCSSLTPATCPFQPRCIKFRCGPVGYRGQAVAQLNAIPGTAEDSEFRRAKSVMDV
jgi:hypothetical protein